MGDFDPFILLTVLHFCLVVGISIRVIMNRPATGVALAWLVIVALVPYGGPVAYFMVGERRISPDRRARLGHRTSSFEELSEILAKEGLTEVRWDEHPQLAREMGILGHNTAGALTFTDNDLELVANPHDCLLYTSPRPRDQRGSRMPSSA